MESNKCSALTVPFGHSHNVNNPLQQQGKYLWVLCGSHTQHRDQYFSETLQITHILFYFLLNLTNKQILFCYVHSISQFEKHWDNLRKAQAAFETFFFFSKFWIFSHLYSQMSISQTSHSFTYTKRLYFCFHSAYINPHVVFWQLTFAIYILFQVSLSSSFIDFPFYYSNICLTLVTCFIIFSWCTYILLFFYFFLPSSPQYLPYSLNIFLLLIYSSTRISLLFYFLMFSLL